jgi:hypothetical protein
MNKYDIFVFFKILGFFVLNLTIIKKNVDFLKKKDCICLFRRETYRVLLHRAMGPGLLGSSVLSVLLLAHIAVSHALVFLLHADNGSGLVPIIVGWVAYTISKALCMFLLVMFSLTCTTMYVFCVATLYCTDGDSGASRRVIRELPRAPTDRLILMFISVATVVIFYIALSALAWLELPHLDGSDKVVVMALHLLGSATFLSGAAYVISSS